MKLLKQPWFLIALFLLSAYSFSLYSGPQISVSPSQAMADDEEVTEQVAGVLKEIEFEKTWTVRKVKDLEISSYQNLDIVFVPSDDEKNVKVKLSGRGRYYKNKGEALKDWFDVKTKGSKLTFKSYSKKLMSLNEFLGKNESLQLRIEFPRTHTFRTIAVESVTGDVQGSDLNFKKISMDSVSGDFKLDNSKGEKITISAVSGDISMDDIQVARGSFKSVSGDSTIKSLSEKPKFNFESVSGDLKLSLPSSSTVNVSFQSMTGELKNEFGAGQAGAAEIGVSSLSGDAKISKIQ